MLQPTVVTWVLVIFGFVTTIPLLIAQFVMLMRPRGQKARDILIGKDEDWRDRTHFSFSYGAAWADWILFLPMLIAGSVGVLTGERWGYVLWGASGAIQLYFNLILWFLEKEFVYPSRGPLVYYTYYWGFFVYWGAAAVIYSALRLING